MLGDEWTGSKSESTGRDGRSECGARDADDVVQAGCATPWVSSNSCLCTRWRPTYDLPHWYPVFITAVAWR